MKNQLFRIEPNNEIINKLLICFGLDDLKDNRHFCRNDLKKLNSVEKLYKIKNELNEYYIPCKSRTYLNDLNEKNVITILRQCIKPSKYTVCSREKYLKGEKFIIYNIVPYDLKDYVSVVGPFEVTKEYRLLTFN